VNRWIESLITFLFPARCRCCGGELGIWRIKYICPDCWAKIRPIRDPVCYICGYPLSLDPILRSTPMEPLCRDCIQTRPSFTKARSAVLYQDAVETAIHLLKFEGKLVMARPLAQLLIEHAPLDEFNDAQMVIPMPLSKKRLAERGFNQVEPLARAVAERMGLEYRDDILIKIRHTPPQSQFQGREKRKRNVIGAFQVKDESSISGLNLLLVDDVLTTGATASEAAKVLLEAGAASVYVLTLARAGI